MRSQVQRAPRSEILDHLEDLLGLDATQIAVQVANLSRVGNSEAAFTTLKTYDATLGGVGVYSITDKHPPGVYRALFYVDMFLRQPGAENHSRFIILSACGYLEELLKYVVRLWPWEKFNADGLPLGALAKRTSEHLPSDLADELAWLSSKVYNFAKHEFNLKHEFGDQQPEHYFQLDEAVAVYLIVRKLGLGLEQLIGKTPGQLMQE